MKHITNMIARRLLDFNISTSDVHELTKVVVNFGSGSEFSSKLQQIADTHHTSKERTWFCGLRSRERRWSALGKRTRLLTVKGEFHSHVRRYAWAPMTLETCREGSMSSLAQMSPEVALGTTW